MYVYEYDTSGLNIKLLVKEPEVTMQAWERLNIPSWFAALADSGREAAVEDGAEEDAAAAVAASAKDNCSALASASSSSNSSLFGAEEGGTVAPPLPLLELLCDCDCADPDPALEVPMLSKAFNLASRAF